MSGRRLVVLATLVLLFLAEAVPRLADRPLVSWDEGGILASAYRKATTGVYANDLYAGWAGFERRNYEYMPLQPLLASLLVTPGTRSVLPVRAVSVVAGLATLLLTVALARRVFGELPALLAGAFLVLVRSSVEPSGSGLPFVDVARAGRYDALVPVFVLSAFLAFVRAEGTRRTPLLALCGLLLGAGTLAHVYAAFPLVLLLPVLLARRDARGALALACGFGLGLVPWLAYVAADPAVFTAQLRRNAGLGRFDLLRPGFVWDSVVLERQRYTHLLARPLLRPGLALTALGLVTAAIRARRRGDRHRRLVVVAGPLFALLLALLVNVKIAAYLVLPLPFVAIACGAALEPLAGSRAGRFVVGAVLLSAAAESLPVVARFAWSSGGPTPYREVVAAIRSKLPAGGRLLIPHWLFPGLADREVRSVYLPFLLSSRFYTPDGRLDMEHAFAAVAPDVVIADRVVEPLLRTLPAPDEDALALDYRRVLLERCPDVLARLDDPTYGPITVRRCR